MTDFSDIIRQWREQKGWTQERLADELQLGGPKTVRRWESREGLPQVTIRERLMKLTGKSAEELGFVDSRGGQESVQNVVCEEDNQPVVVHNADDTRAVPSFSHRKENRLPILKSRSSLSEHRKPIVFLSLVALLLLGLLFTQMFRVSTSSSTSHQASGQVSFLSSHQTNDDTNQGIDDGVRVTIQHLPPPESGEKYYAWLEPANPENSSLQLGVVSVQNGMGTLLYESQDHSNLLDYAAHIVVTEQDSTSTLLGPSLLQPDQKYMANIPNTHPSVTASDPYSQEYAQYGLLDHLRHLLSSDPTLIARGVRGGLVPLLDSQTAQVLWWAKNARDMWGTSTVSSALLHDQITRILNVLDGTATMDSPPTPIVVNRSVSSFSLLPKPGQPAQESYIAHVDLHLRGVRASPGATEQMRALAATLIANLVGITADLQRVRTDATTLFSMKQAQLNSTQAFSVLNDLLSAANVSYAGPTGVFSLSLSMETLATMDVFACTPSLCHG